MKLLNDSIYNNKTSNSTNFTIKETPYEAKKQKYSHFHSKTI